MVEYPDTAPVCAKYKSMLLFLKQQIVYRYRRNVGIERGPVGAAVEGRPCSFLSSHYQEVGVRRMFSQPMDRSRRQARHDRLPCLAEVLAAENPGSIVVVEMPIDGEINSPGCVLRWHDAADVQHRGKSVDISGQVGPMRAAVAGNLDPAIVATGIQKIAVERRFGNYGQCTEITLAIVLRKRASRDGLSHHLKFGAIHVAGKVRADGFPADAAIGGAKDLVGAGIYRSCIEL